MYLVPGGERGDAQVPKGVPSSSIATDHEDDRKIRDRLRVVVPIGRGGDGIREAPPHRDIHQESSDNHSAEGCLPLSLCTVQIGRADAREELVGVMVGSRRGK